MSNTTTAATTTTRVAKGRTVAVVDQVQALVLKKALEDFIKNIETGTGAEDTLVSNESIIVAAEDLLTSVDATVYFHTKETVTRKRTPKKKIETETTEATA